MLTFALLLAIPPNIQGKGFREHNVNNHLLHHCNSMGAGALRLKIARTKATVDQQLLKTGVEVLHNHNQTNMVTITTSELEEEINVEKQMQRERTETTGKKNTSLNQNQIITANFRKGGGGKKCKAPLKRSHDNVHSGDKQANASAVRKVL